MLQPTNQYLTYLDDLSTVVFAEEIQEEANSYFQQVLSFLVLNLLIILI